MAKTNTGLVNYAKKALKENYGYCLGTYGQILTPAVLAAKQRQGYGVGAYNTRHDAYLKRFLNRRVSDCYGLVKGYLWEKPAYINPKYDGKTDRNQEMAYRAAKEKGPLNTIPEIPGVVLWMRGHAGVYIGNGEFIEIAGAPRGMIKGKIVNGRVTKGSRFTHWFKDTYIEYGEGTAKPAEKPNVNEPEGKNFTSIVNYLKSQGIDSSKENRKKLAAEYGIKDYNFTAKQNLQLIDLMQTGKPVTTKENLVIDGWWGEKTTRALQRALGTPEDGVISGQYPNNTTRAIPSATFATRKGSLLIMAIQNKLGITKDGYIGPVTVRALQKYLGTLQDGIISKPSAMVKEMQIRLNAGTF